MTGPLIFLGAWAVLILLWGLDKPSVTSVYVRLDPSLRCKGAGGVTPTSSASARVREVVTGDERELLVLIDSERNRP
jgi:hypothetical protein